MTDFTALLQLLSEGRVQFIMIGGVAATAHGSVRLTQDLDIVYCRSEDNISRLVAALKPIDPYLRDAPPGLPFQWNRTAVERGLNFTLSTSLGAIDLFGEIVGGGNYEDLLPHTISLRVFGIECRCLNLDWLIRVKRAAGRPKDLEVLAELEALREEME